jgi:hypothetical protein
MCPRARRKRIAPATNTDGVDLFPMEIQGVPTTGPSGSGNRCRWGSGAMFALPVHNHVPQPGGCDRGPNLAKRSLQVNTRLWNIALMYRCLVWTLLGRTQCMPAGIIGVMDSFGYLRNDRRDKRCDRRIDSYMLGRSGRVQRLLLFR